MMGEQVYQRKEPVKPGLFNSIFGLREKANAVVDLNNLLSSKSLLEVQHDEVKAIAKSYGVNFMESFQAETIELYRTYLNFVVNDLKISENEYDTIKHLQNILDLPDDIALSVNKSVFGNLFQEKYIQAVLIAKKSMKNDDIFLMLKENYRLSDEFVGQLIDEAHWSVFNTKLHDVFEDNKVSPYEDESLKTLAHELGLDVNLSEETHGSIDKMRRYWKLEYGEIEGIAINIHLHNGEICYYSLASVNWYEWRAAVRRINYAGPAGRINLFKGLDFKIGSVGLDVVHEDEMKLIETGSLYVTNKRIIFVGSKKSTTIGLSRILAVKPFLEGVEIIKDGGKTPFIAFDTDPLELSIIVSRLLNAGQDNKDDK